MEYNKPIARFARGDEVQGFYILTVAHAKTTAAGKPFLNGTLADRSAAIDFVLWDYSGPVGEKNMGTVVKVKGEVTEYRGALQFNLTRIRAAAEDDRYDVSALVPAAPIDPGPTLERVRQLTASIEDADYRRVAQSLLEAHLDEFRNAPAAKSIHHAFLHGLLMHTAAMMELADFLSRQYAGVVDRSLLLAGTLLHDFSKPEEFALTPLGLAAGYSVRGELLGHLVMGAEAVASAAAALGIPEEKSTLLQHLTLSHHGEPEFGAAVRPMCAEAELLSLIDRIDSRMEICREVLSDVPVGSFSDRIFALDGRKLYRHS